ncbi:MAG: ABC transporter ATP-binding protein [Alphaproteobacteria bacterium]|nr:ABC transporter ATP-binding protein [Alphaproteobacteria bacterium]
MPDPSEGPAVALEEVRHAFATVLAVDAVTLSVRAREILCLVGPSGCGKTTLLRLVAGLEHIQAGRVRLGGQLVADAAAGLDTPPDERGVGLVFQDYALFPHLDILENVAFGLRALEPAARKDRATAALDQVGLSEQAGAYPHMLSGGQQQRVALARALAPGPRLLLLDEPFAGLDARLRDQVRDDVYHILKDSGTACLIVTHDAEEAMFMADRIAVLRAGRLEQIGAPTEIYSQPASAFVTRFFSDVNRLVGTVETGAVKTPFGRIPADAAGDGDRVEILIRPEALRIAPLGTKIASWGVPAPSGGSRARVIATRMLGRSSLIHLDVANDGNRGLHMHSRMPGQVLPPEGEVVSVDLDLDQAFVFPLTDTT